MVDLFLPCSVLARLCAGLQINELVHLGGIWDKVRLTADFDDPTGYAVFCSYFGLASFVNAK